MGTWRGSVGVLVLCGVVSHTFLRQADGAEPESRKGFSGKQLFEHEWQWTGPAPKVDIRQRVRTPEELVGDGLGPLYNATSCAACHAGGGASDVTRNVTLITIDPRSKSLGQGKATGGKSLRKLFPGVIGPAGVVNFNALVHDHSIRDGYDKIRAGLSDAVPGGMEAGWFDPESRTSAAIAEQPVIAGRLGPTDFYLSQRNAQALYGLGAIEAISDARIRGVALKQAKLTKGEITGRFVGKFGWRGQVQSLAAFVSGACAAELGLTQRNVLPNEDGMFKVSLRGGSLQADDPADPSYVNLGIDMTGREVSLLVGFVASLPRPVERVHATYSSGEILDGEKVFNSVGCATCHVADLRPVSGIFSDLLLHDMGPRLQAPSPAPIGDQTVPVSVQLAPIVNSISPSFSGAVYYSDAGRMIPTPYDYPVPEQPQFPRGESSVFSEQEELNWEVMQREWKTPPLWGVADTAPYLHDGRAETIGEAILWHGGEAEKSRARYSKLTQREKDLLLAFLSTLQEPDVE